MNGDSVKDWWPVGVGGRDMALMNTICGFQRTVLRFVGGGV